jgi:hypothetical protein
MGQGRKNAFVINDDQMALYIDLRLGKAAIDSLLRMADIKGTNANDILKGAYDDLIKDGWTVRTSEKNLLILLKPLDELGANPLVRSVLVTHNQANGTVNEKRAGYPGPVTYGVNNFAKVTIHELPSGLTRFYLPGNLSARKVMLSGNFNNWNTLKGVMGKTDSGWVADVKLNPGEYLYKFIVNGHWIHDTNNNLKEPDGYNGYNSIYFRYNYTFKLKGFNQAARVMVLGSFNKWNATELVMLPQKGVWTKSLFLAEGMVSYRFLVDGKDITDPANPSVRDDESGKPVSVINLGTDVVFKLKGYGNAKNVILAGDFNNWNTSQLHMKHIGDTWVLPCTLAAGNYGYKFIVDGNWITDPANQHKVEFNGQTNSFIAVKPTHVFVLHGFGDAHVIRLSGTFNDWSQSGYTLKHEGNDWTISLNLKPGKYLYKFIIDGRWIIDPGNKLWEQNQFGTGNSVLWLE